jgi:hypothetical protein
MREIDEGVVGQKSYLWCKHGRRKGLCGHHHQIKMHHGMDHSQAERGTVAPFSFIRYAVRLPGSAMQCSAVLCCAVLCCAVPWHVHHASVTSRRRQTDAPRLKGESSSLTGVLFRTEVDHGCRGWRWALTSTVRHPHMNSPCRHHHTSGRPGGLNDPLPPAQSVPWACRWLSVPVAQYRPPPLIGRIVEMQRPMCASPPAMATKREKRESVSPSHSFSTLLEEHPEEDWVFLHTRVQVRRVGVRL